MCLLHETYERHEKPRYAGITRIRKPAGTFNHTFVHAQRQSRRRHKQSLLCALFCRILYTIRTVVVKRRQAQFPASPHLAGAANSIARTRSSRQCDMVCRHGAMTNPLRRSGAISLRQKSTVGGNHSPFSELYSSPGTSCGWSVIPATGMKVATQRCLVFSLAAGFGIVSFTWFQPLRRQIGVGSRMTYS